LERELESLQQKLLAQEDKSNKMYLHMYAKDQEQAGPSTSSSTPSRVSVPELLHQLQVTQDELENLKVSARSFFNYFLCFNVFHGHITHKINEETILCGRAHS
jgi:hypothetical protein